MIKHLKQVIVLALLSIAFKGFTQQATTPVGTGTQSDPYKISTLNNLYWMAENVNGWYNFFEGKYLVQTNDIDASDTKNWNGGLGWKPVGDSLNFHFKGNYDGGGFSINGLYINRPSTNCNGLFGYAELGSIRNLSLSNVSVIGQHGTGALIGISLVPIRRCSASGTVKGTKYTAGLVGINKGTIDTSFSSCLVTGTEESGGLVGASTGAINQCYCTGSVAGNLKIGGFIGSNGAKISDCYATGNVTRLSGATATTFCNFVGYSVSYTYNSYATGQVIYDGAASPTNRGFGPYNSYCFYDTETSLQTSGYGTAKTTAEMQQARTFALASWDFKGDGAKGIWNIGNGRNNGYPYFNWQFAADPIPVLNLEPIVSMGSVAYRGGDTARAGASITRLGNPVATEYGFCWSTNSNPSIADSRLSLGVPTTKGTFSAQINGLQMGITYYLRSYIISAIDTTYSTVSSLQTYSIPSGAGTLTNPYLISCLSDLYWIYRQVNSNYNTLSGNYFLQTNDINVAKTKSWNGGSGWYSIGTSSYRFSGVYNGNNYSIDSLYGACLFAYTKDAVIKNLSITNCTIKGSSYVAALVGFASGSSVIDSCHAQGTVTGATYVGGLIGSGGQVSNASFEGYVSGTSPVGGLVATASSVYRCWANGKVTGTIRVGGLVGESNEPIRESYSNGQVSGTEYVGGLVGFCSNISNSYSHCLVTRTSGSATSFGGLVGYLSAINAENCYATGKVQYVEGTSPSNKGISGGYGTYSLGQRYINTFWDTETSAQTADVCPAEGKSTVQMTNSATFIAAGWDFISVGKTGIWNIGNARNNGYPYFYWQYPTDQFGANNVAPSVSAPIVKRIDAATATIQVLVSSKGIPTATQHGLCWNTTGMPTIADSKSEMGVIASFDTIKTSITGLIANTIYYVRAYATNTNGTYYSAEVSIVYAPTPSGNGTKNNPYLISNVFELFWLQQQCNIHDSTYLNTYFKQTANIDLSVSTKLNNGMGWDGIQRFRGIYDGDFHTVDGLFIYRPNETWQGLWGNMETYGKILNLGVTNASVTASIDVGVLVGIARFDSIVNCYATGTVRGYSEVGGLVGYLHYSTAQWSYSAVDVWGEYAVGGFSGRNFNPSRESNNCYSRGSVTRTTGNAISIASFIGSNVGGFKNCYSTGFVSYANETGKPQNKGFIGDGFKGTVYDSYFDNQTTGQLSDTLSYAYGYPSSVMKQGFLYGSWNFTPTTTPYWKIDAAHNDGYPYFWWQVFPNTATVKTNAMSAITATTATANWQLLTVGASAPTAHGVCWNTTGNPTTADSKKDLGATSAIGSYNAIISGLQPCTNYYLRAFTTNSAGTAYGTQVSFTLLDTEAPSISWTLGSQTLAANASLPDYTSQATVSDNCAAAKLTVSQLPAAGSIGLQYPLTVTLTAKDAAGNSSQTSFTVTQSFIQQSIPLAKGWNLISINVHPADSTIEALFQGLDVIEIKTMDLFWRTGQNTAFNSLKTIESGEGYLVKMNSTGILSLLGSENLSGLSSTKSGWNLIGCPFQTATSFPSLFNSLNCSVIKDFEGFWIPNGTTNSLQTFEPGKGYFMKP